MKRFRATSFLLFLLAVQGLGQGPTLTYGDLWTLAYEDLSDLLRRYPGMYPIDYGTIGQPVLFRPWHFNPWELQLERDGVPQNRRSDGVFDPNLQPASELDSLRYDLLSGGGGGLFRMQTRKLPVDSPYTEFQIREGWHGYGTVDFGHGQRVYRSMTLELTGRLVWYEGFRPQRASRFQRIRGRVGFDLGTRWRGGVTYAGSNVDSEFPLHPSGPYSEREEAVFEMNQTDTLRTALNPSLRLYVREDRENWGGSFRLREGVAGWSAQARAAYARHEFTLRQTGTYAEIGLSGTPEVTELTAGLAAQDSMNMEVAGLRVFGEIVGEQVVDEPRDEPARLLPGGGAELNTRPWRGFWVRFGTHYSEVLPPVAWTRARFDINAWPRLVAPAFGDTMRIYSGSAYGVERDVDRYLKNLLALGWTRGGTLIEVTGMAVDRVGSSGNEFVVLADTAVALRYLPLPNDPRYGGMLTARLPLGYGLRIDSWSFAQLTTDLEREETRTFSRLYFERDFFTAPLTVRSHVSHEYIGPRTVYSERGVSVIRPANLVGLRLSATIHGVTLIWGTENLFKQQYQLVPGYPMVAKEEYIGVIWRLWL